MKSIKRANSTASATLLLSTLGGSIFFGEVLIMMLLRVLSPLSPWAANLLDSSLLILIIFPILYFVVVRPLKVHITEQKRAEESLRESEDKFHLVFENAYDGISIFEESPDFNRRKLVDCNLRYAEMAGRTREELIQIGNTAELARSLSKDNSESIEQAVAFRGSYSWIRPDGKDNIIEYTAMPIKMAGKTLTIGIDRDITERKRAEEEQEKSESKFRAIFDNASDGMFLIDLKAQKFFMCNATCAKMLGYPQEEFPNLDIADIHPKEDLPFIYEQVGKFSRGEEGIRSDIRFKRKDGSILVTDLSPALLTIAERKYLLVNLRDITERKRAEEALRVSESSLQGILHSTADGILVVSKERKILFVNDRFTQMWKIPPEIIETKNDSIFLHTFLDQLIDPKGFRQRIEEVYESTEESFDTLQFKDGRIFEGLSRPLMQEADMRGRVWSFSDITERKRSEEALQASEQRYRFIATRTLDGIFTVDLEGCLTFVGPNWLTITGYTEADVLGHRMIDFVPEEYRAMAWGKFTRSLTGEQIGLFEIPILMADGSSRPFELNTSNLNDDSGALTGSIGVFRDITERKRAERLTEGLYEISKAIHSADNVNELFRQIHRVLSSILRANNFYIALLTDDGKALTFPYEVDEKDSGVSSVINMENSESLTVEVVKTKKPLLLDEKELLDRYATGRNKVWGTAPKCWLGVPLMIRETVIGVMAVQDYHQSGVYSRKDVTLFESAAGQIAIAIERKRAERALKESELKFKEMFDNAPVGYHEIDADGRIVRVNATELNLLGYVSQEMEGHFVWEFLDDQEVSRQSILAKLSGAKLPAKGVERVYKRKDLSTITVVSEDGILWDAKGRITGIRTTVQDITERKKGEQLRLLLTTALESAANGVAITDLKGTIAWINKAFTEMTGYSPADAIGQNPSILKSGKVSDSFYKKLWETITAGNFWQGELINKKKDGSLYTDKMTITPLKNTNGEITNFIAIKEDITERKRTELMRHVLYDIAHAATTTENMDEFFGSIRSSLGKLIDTSNFFVALYDIESGSLSFPYFIDEQDAPPHPRLLGKGLTDYIIRSGKPLFADVRTCKELEQQGRIETIGTPSEVWLGAPLKLGEKVFGAIVVQSYIDPQCYRKTDIDILEFVSNQISQTIDRKQAQEKIRTQMTIIEETINQLAQTRDQAMEASKTKSSFLATMSHELRTPLNAIIGYSEILLEEMGDVGEFAYTKDIEKIRTAGNNLLALINDILDISKIEAGRMELFIEEFDLRILLEEINATIKPLVDKKSNTLAVQEPATSILLRLDHTKVRQILFNLLSNSCKFTNAGKITLSVSVDNSRTTFDHDVVIFSVKDSGIGMTPEEMKKLFLDFSQTDSSTTRKYGGTGLGLAITKKFCEMMNGSIDVQSIPDEGTTFTVVLPISIEGTQKAPSAPSSMHGGMSTISRPSGPTVLIVDDDTNVRELLTRVLTKEGYSPVSAGNGIEGLALARTLFPTVIILDVMMPQKDGWAVLRELKDDPALKSIPVIMHTIIDNRNLGFAIGAQDYLIKPVDHETLVATIKRYTKPARPMNILIVDDEPDQREILSRIMLKEGWNVRAADGGRMALALLAQSLPDVITLDLMMPTMDGFEFLKLVKENEQWSHIPILILTSMNLNSSEYNILKGSVASILHKGEFNAQQLLGLVRRYAHTALEENVNHEKAPI